MEFHPAIKKNEILWMELEYIILSEVSQVQKTKGCMFSLIYGMQTQYKYSNIMKNRSH
jgi:hypothetical protein